MNGVIWSTMTLFDIIDSHTSVGLIYFTDKSGIAFILADNLKAFVETTNSNSINVWATYKKIF